MFPVRAGTVLVNTSLMNVGSNVMSGTFVGGQGVLVIGAQQFAPIVNLIYKAGDGASARQIKMNSTAMQANEVRFFFLPAGVYEIHSATGSSIGMYAALVTTP